MFTVIITEIGERFQSFLIGYRNNSKLYSEVICMKKRAVVSVIGKDQVGIIAKVTNVLAENKMNVLDISQTILQDFFTMMMLVEIESGEDLDALLQQFKEIEKELGLTISIQLEDVFQAMHRI